MAWGRGTTRRRAFKTGGLRNYIDLREWTSTSLSDEPDPALAHIARKGPTAPTTKRVKKGVSSSTRSPLSSSQIEQIKGTRSPYTTATPSGSSVKPQEGSVKKEKKKRPWLLQLAVISTALCLLGALIVGLAYNLGDWFNQEDPDSGDNSTVQTNVEPEKKLDSDSNELAPGSFAKLNRVEYLKIAEKNRFLRWVKLDVGADEPIRINVKDEQFDQFESALDKSSEGDELRVVIKEIDDELVFEDLAIAPEPSERGERREIDFQELGNLEVIRNENELELKVGDEVLSYDLRRVSKDDAQRMLRLGEIIKKGERIPLELRLEGSRIVHVEPFKMPGDSEIVNSETDDLPKEEEMGEPMVLKSLSGKGTAYFDRKQFRIHLPINGTTRKAYTFKEEEAERIEELYDFLERDLGKVDINIKFDGTKITELEFELPKTNTEPDEQKPLLSQDYIVGKKFLFWIPGKKSNGSWTIDESSKSFTYTNPEAASFLFSYFEKNSKKVPNPKAWMIDYPKASLLNTDYFNDSSEVEDFTFECNINSHPLDPVKIATVSFKLGNTYSFDFEITDGKSIEISYDASHAWNSLNRGKVIRLPVGDSVSESVDLFLLSNRHSDLNEKVEIGQNYNFSNKTLNLPSNLLAKDSFKFLSPDPDQYQFFISVVDSSDRSVRTLFSKPSWKNFIDFKKGKLSGLPNALLQLDENVPSRATILLDLDYFRSLSDQILREKEKCDMRLQELGSGFPDQSVYQNLENYGKGSKNLMLYQNGTPFTSFAYELPLSFIKKYFQWDDVKFNNFRSELDVVFNNKILLEDPALFLQYWQRLGSEVEKYILNRLKDFNYNESSAIEDSSLLFDFLTLILKTEQALGVPDRDFLKGMGLIRQNLASPSPDKVFGVLNSEVISLSKNNPKLREIFKKTYDQYNDLQRTLVPSAKLDSASLKIALDTLSDRGKSVIYKEKQSEIFQNKSWSDIFGSITQEILKEQELIIKNFSVDSAVRSQKILGEIPWSYAVYKKKSDGTWEKLSDFLRLASPSNI